MSVTRLHPSSWKNFLELIVGNFIIFREERPLSDQNSLRDSFCQVNFCLFILLFVYTEDGSGKNGTPLKSTWRVTGSELTFRTIKLHLWVYPVLNHFIPTILYTPWIFIIILLSLISEPHTFMTYRSYVYFWRECLERPFSWTDMTYSEDDMVN